MALLKDNLFVDGVDLVSPNKFVDPHSYQSSVSVIPAPSFRSISFHFVPFRSISFHFGSFRAISGHFGPFISFSLCVWGGWNLPQWECKVVTSFWQYFIMANYSWIFMEGLYLHNLIFMALFTDSSAITIYIFLGWGKSATNESNDEPMSVSIKRFDRSAARLCFTVDHHAGHVRRPHLLDDQQQRVHLLAHPRPHHRLHSGKSMRRPDGHQWSRLTLQRLSFSFSFSFSFSLFFTRCWKLFRSTSYSSYTSSGCSCPNFAPLCRQKRASTGIGKLPCFQCNPTINPISVRTNQTSTAPITTTNRQRDAKTDRHTHTHNTQTHTHTHTERQLGTDKRREIPLTFCLFLSVSVCFCLFLSLWVFE